MINFSSLEIINLKEDEILFDEILTCDGSLWFENYSIALDCYANQEKWILEDSEFEFIEKDIVIRQLIYLDNNDFLCLMNNYTLEYNFGLNIISGEYEISKNQFIDSYAKVINKDDKNDYFYIKNEKKPRIQFYGYDKEILLNDVEEFLK